MKKIISPLLIAIAIGLVVYFVSINISEVDAQPVTVTPISHATAVLEWDGAVIYTDPVGGKEAFTNQPEPLLILVTDIHGDHLSVETLEAIMTDNTLIVAPQAVADELSEDLLTRTLVMQNGEMVSNSGFSIEAIPAYNIPESPDAFHVEGRGNGYVLEHNDFRVYIAGDTAGIPEMRALQNIDMAFVPMNLPFTMDVDEAADAVLEFKPKQVYPYHYRGRDGLHDIERFKSLVDAGGEDIEVILLDWYQN